MSERDGLKIIDQLPLDFDRKACPSNGGAPFSRLLKAAAIAAALGALLLILARGSWSH